MEKFTALLEFELLGSHVFGNSCHVSIDECVRVTFAAFTSIATVIEASDLEHLPYSWVAPVVRPFLGPDAYIEIVMASFEIGWNRPV